MTTVPIVTLNNGTKVPALGLGELHLYQFKWITSKLWGTWHSRVEECLDQTLTNLGTDYLDLYLIHWPIPLNPNGNHPIFPTLPDGTRDIDHSWRLSDTWKQMEALLRKGKVKAIGVSNFSKAKLEEILPTAEIVPAVNQLELHVYNPQHELIKYLKSKNITPEAYSPLGSTNSPLLTDETVLKIAHKYSLSAADVLIGYLVSKGIVVIPKSVTPSRIASNLNGPVIAANKLGATDIAELDGLAAAGKQKSCGYPKSSLESKYDLYSIVMPTAVSGRDLDMTSDAIDEVNVLKGRLWDDESQFDTDKDKEKFRNYDMACDRVKNFYKEQHEKQTVQFNIQARVNFKKRTRARMGVWEAMEMLNTLVDESDPDVSHGHLRVF
ncbi:hypothetical protein C0993_007399 [Termitomyces sp. T159_Od127]|nr:hypothetical protein C0993_007399 [Termitomyces sp. T159_Od127]